MVNYLGLTLFDLAMSQSVQNNQKKILRFLYSNSETTHTRRQIQNATGLTESQFRYAISSLDNYFDREQRKIKGEINGAYEYQINHHGRDYVENNVDKIPIKVKNSEELETQKQEIIELKSTVDNIKYWMEWSENWNEVAQKRFENIRERIEKLEAEEFADEYEYPHQLKQEGEGENDGKETVLDRMTDKERANLLPHKVQRWADEAEREKGRLELVSQALINELNRGNEVTEVDAELCLEHVDLDTDEYGVRDLPRLMMIGGEIERI